MSSRTKSFFDQNQKDKPRPGQWHRPSNKAPLNETNGNLLPPKPPIPATSQAKSKLKSFQFVAGHPNEPQQDVADKENETEARAEGQTASSQGTVTGDHEPLEKAVSSGNGKDQRSTDTAQLPHAHTFPCTPGTRLPLEDLIGNCDDNDRRVQPSDPTPEEHIGWIPNSSSNLLTPSRKRKRARSSSPSCPNTSSQRQEASLFFPGTAGPGDKRTPEADPVADLWQRYATGKQADEPSNLPDLGQLIFQLSPRKLETPAKSAGLRRWASTGNDWPTSKSKRRRTNGKPSTSLWQDRQVEESGGKSKVAAMVEKLQESLASQRIEQPQSKPAARVDGPSSSSPLPDAGATESLGGASATSPLQARQRLPTARMEQPCAAKDVPKPVSGAGHRAVAGIVDNTGSHHEPEPTPKPAAPPPDFVAFAPLQLQLQNKPLPAYRRPRMSRTPSTGVHYPQRTTPPAPAPVPAQPLPADSENFDEFGDDLELSAEDLDELMIQPPPLHERPLHQIPPHPNPPPQHTMSLEAERDAATDANRLGEHAVRPISTDDIDVLANEFNDDDDDDEFGCDDLDEASMAQAEMSATQAFRASLSNSNIPNISPRKRSPRKSSSPSKGRSPKKASQLKSSSNPSKPLKFLQRCVVKQVVESEYTNAKGRRCPEKVILGEDERTSRCTAISIRDSWVATSIARGNIIHVARLRQSEPIVAPSTPPGQLTIFDAEDSPLLIVHPDHMLSATTIADSFDCIRKAVLQDRIKATSEAHKALVYGKILHEIFQQALLANRWDEAFLAELVERTVQSHVEGLWELGMSDTNLAVEEVRAKMAELASWARIFVAKNPSEVALVDDRHDEKIWMSISKLIAVEEHIWSPRFGLKGNIDATVEASFLDHTKEASKKLIVPFEVKTGKTTQSAEHRAQTALYTLLMSDRYDVSVKAGMLYYLESSTISRIAPPTIEIRQMIQQRNRLAAYIHRARNPAKTQEDRVPPPQTQEIEESGLPGLLKNPFRCGRCYAQQSCFSYHALVEGGSAQTAGMVDDGKKNHASVWQEAVGHLQLSSKDKAHAQTLKQWFAQWDRLLTFEESDVSKLRKELWTMDSTEREAVGRCFGNLVISQDLNSTASTITSTVVDGVEGSGGKINRFAYVFVRSNTSAGKSFTDGSQLTVGEPVVVSSESGQWALATGYIIAVTKHDITVAVDRKLGNARQRHAEFDDARNQAFRGIMTVGEERARSSSPSKPELLCRLDKDEFSNGLAMVRNNLVTLMSSHPIHTKLRNQLIFSTKPLFTASSPIPSLQPSQLGEMNEDQVAAVSKVRNAQDYALILGMPGTGKTTTIAHIIQALLAEQRTILLTSYTHTAVDNILLKIRDIAPPNSILRLGTPSKINRKVQEFCQLAATLRTTIDEIETAYMGCQIVATTCMGTNHAIFNRRAFDVCIVDEASQITLPTSLGPLLHARKFVLVGDHYQLPPLVQNKAALEGGLDISLFRQLSEEHPEAVATLGKQYRMCADIMSLSNVLIYDGQLRCGNEAVAQRKLQNVDLSALDASHNMPSSCGQALMSGKCWLTDLLRPERKVAFANTDLSGKAAMETLTSGKNITNQYEAALAATLVSGLLAIGVPGKEIGVMTLYRSQLALIRRVFKTAGITGEVEIDSADRFQGRDKECIILSMVRFNEPGIVGDLLKDWRRVNVALTRAKSKLIVLGSRRTLRNNELLARFLTLVDGNGWALDIPRDADLSHSFGSTLQAASDVTAQDSPSRAKKLSGLSSKKVAARKSPQKATLSASARVLKESTSAANRSPSKKAAIKKPGKVISGRGSPGLSKFTQEATFEIFEDLNGDNF
ncbi:DNA replication endonuclease-helicase Dna2 [Vermiconidia calcicola]|uniref:DNA replication endonuclease-helicase Dna2 n=1 Tax=Vermiconidia calcicola TaxID=1690605 RepID=A0ACC3NP40_9PEZI|nr:DNA replication endonuclease-helicase Dna2 [Vermiconidia calcicola]